MIEETRNGGSLGSKSVLVWFGASHAAGVMFPLSGGDRWVRQMARIAGMNRWLSRSNIVSSSVFDPVICIPCIPAGNARGYLEECIVGTIAIVSTTRLSTDLVASLFTLNLVGWASMTKDKP
ncbi:MAG: hypothetical protein MO846_08775, partial [Candidatus Devosia symbiotica]|nr:hypothetical protein [Candidatus Devosia symbiotica]